MRSLPQARRRSSRSTIRPKTSSPPPRPRPAARAPMLSSTWSEATTSSATTRPPPSKAGWCRSPSRARRRLPSIFAASCSSACTHTGSTLRARSVADKGAIARAVEEHVLPLIAAGRVKPVMDSTFPAGAGGSRARPHGDERPYRQDRADGLSYSARPRRASGTPVRQGRRVKGREIDAMFARMCSSARGCVRTVGRPGRFGLGCLAKRGSFEFRPRRRLAGAPC